MVIHAILIAITTHFNDFFIVYSFVLFAHFVLVLARLHAKNTPNAESRAKLIKRKRTNWGCVFANGLVFEIPLALAGNTFTGNP